MYKMYCITNMYVQYQPETETLNLIELNLIELNLIELNLIELNLISIKIDKKLIVIKT
jgi:hypothetical protein